MYTVIQWRECEACFGTRTEPYTTFVVQHYSTILLGFYAQLRYLYLLCVLLACGTVSVRGTIVGHTGNRCQSNRPIKGGVWKGKLDGYANLLLVSGRCQISLVSRTSINT